MYFNKVTYNGITPTIQQTAFPVGTSITIDTSITFDSESVFIGINEDSNGDIHSGSGTASSGSTLVTPSETKWEYWVNGDYIGEQIFTGTSNDYCRLKKIPGCKLASANKIYFGTTFTVKIKATVLATVTTTGSYLRFPNYSTTDPDTSHYMQAAYGLVL